MKKYKFNLLMQIFKIVLVFILSLNMFYGCSSVSHNETGNRNFNDDLNFDDGDNNLSGSEDSKYKIKILNGNSTVNLKESKCVDLVAQVNPEGPQVL